MQLEEINAIAVAVVEVTKPLMEQIQTLSEKVDKLHEQLEQAENLNKQKKLDKFYDDIV